MNEEEIPTKVSSQPRNNDLLYLLLGGLAGFVLALTVTGYHTKHQSTQKGSTTNNEHSEEVSNH